MLTSIERHEDDFEEVSCLKLTICTKNAFCVKRVILSAVKKRSRSNFWTNKQRDSHEISPIKTSVFRLGLTDFGLGFRLTGIDFSWHDPGLTIAICNKITALSAISGTIYSRWPQEIFLYPGGHWHWLGLTHVPPFWQGILQMAAQDKKTVGYTHLLSFLWLKTGLINGLYNLRSAPECTT